MPVVQELGGRDGTAFTPEIWVGAVDQAITARDTATTAILSLPIFLIGAIVIWMLLSVARRDYQDLGL
jgi:hypothetical protein